MRISGWFGMGIVIVDSVVRFCITMLASALANFLEAVLFQQSTKLSA